MSQDAKVPDYKYGDILPSISPEEKTTLTLYVVEEKSYKTRLDNALNELVKAIANKTNSTYLLPTTLPDISGQVGVVFRGDSAKTAFLNGMNDLA